MNEEEPSLHCSLLSTTSVRFVWLSEPWQLGSNHPQCPWASPSGLPCFFGARMASAII